MSAAFPRDTPYDQQVLRHLAGEIITNVRELAQAGWTPATSSNFSRRLDDRHAAITVSGRDKGRLTEADIMVVDFDGRAVGSDHRPSAETLLHTQLYRRFAEVGCVLHTHSRVQTVASRLFAGDGQVRLEGYELLKAFHGNTTHETEIALPVLPNSPCQTSPSDSCFAPIAMLARTTATRIRAESSSPAARAARRLGDTGTDGARSWGGLSTNTQLG